MMTEKDLTIQDLRRENEWLKKRIELAEIEKIIIHEPTKSEFKRMAAQMGYAPVRHGEWEGYTHSQFWGLDEFSEPIYRDGVVYYCSNPRCRRKTVIKENYCPSCGAKMDGGGKK